MLDLHKTMRVSHLVAYPIALFFQFMSEGGRKECYEKLLFFNKVSRLSHFRYVFGHMRE